MATATITLLSACAGGEHVRVRLTVGAQNFDYDYTAEDISLAISPEERRDAVLTIIRFHCGGMTKAQAKTELQSPGISVVTS